MIKLINICSNSDKLFKNELLFFEALEANNYDVMKYLLDTKAIGINKRLPLDSRRTGYFMNLSRDGIVCSTFLYQSLLNDEMNSSPKSKQTIILLLCYGAEISEFLKSKYFLFFAHEWPLLQIFYCLQVRMLDHMF